MELSPKGVAGWVSRVCVEGLRYARVLLSTRVDAVHDGVSGTCSVEHLQRRVLPST